MNSASLRANAQINRYLIRLGSSHWATLRASVRRGGRYSGASDINLPLECALRFEEPIAELWGKEILRDIRQETRNYVSDCVRLVEEVSVWALSQGARVQPKLVEAQRDAIRADAKKLESVGREMVKEIREEAKTKLITSIEGPIKRRCDSFVKKNLDVGIGVKRRILELYINMADEVTDAAQEPAARILQKLFKDVETEISTHSKNMKILWMHWPNPSWLHKSPTSNIVMRRNAAEHLLNWMRYSMGSQTKLLLLIRFSFGGCDERNTDLQEG